MDWEVTVALNSHSKTYSISADKYYQAKVTGLANYMSEFSIPGRPYTFLHSKKGLLNISVKCLVDSRTVSKVVTREFYLDQIESLKKSLRVSNLGESIVSKASGHLQKASEVLS